MNAAVFPECGSSAGWRDDRLRDVSMEAPAPAPATTGVDRAIALWRAADADLSPLVGRRGALAVLRRALALNRAAFAWLPVPEDVLDFEEADTRLRDAFARQRPRDAEAAASALTTTFSDLLSSLLGAALARQLLRSVRAHRGMPGIERAGPQ